MVKLEALDPSTPMDIQLREDIGPIVLMNTFVVPEGTIETVMANWRDDAEIMKAQPGYISAQLHRGVAGSRILVNISVWESTEALFNALSNPDFQMKARRYPEGVVAYPHILQKVAIEGVCVV